MEVHLTSTALIFYKLTLQEYDQVMTPGNNPWERSNRAPPDLDFSCSLYYNTRWELSEIMAEG